MDFTPEQAFAQVAAAFRLHWGETVTGQTISPGETPIAWDNVDFDPSASVPAPDAGWVRFSWQPTDGSQASLGDDAGGVLFRRQGLAFVQIFTPHGKGLARARELEALALEFFEAGFSGRVWFRNQASKPVGSDGAWHQINVSAEFVYDSTRRA